MKADLGSLERALAKPGEIRFFLFHGPDEAGSRALAARVGDALGEGAERIDLAATELRADPVRLSDEAAAISMFGGARWVLVDPAGDETVGALEALVAAPAAGNPVALVAGSLRPASRLLRLALAARNAIAFASYLPEGANADRLVAELASKHGLQVSPDVARRIAEACGGNRAVIEQELVKFALYLNAGPEAPRTLGHEAIDAVGAASDEGGLDRLAASVAAGDGAALAEELARLHGEGVEGITLVRAVLRRMMLIARLRAEVEGGRSVKQAIGSAGRAVFWKDEAAVGAQVARWRPPLLAKAVSRLIEAERQVKATGGPGALAIDEELFAICRQAARLR